MVQLARIEQREGTRNKIYAVLDLINDPNKLQQERQKAHALKSKFQGYSNESPPPPASRDYAPRSPVPNTSYAERPNSYAEKSSSNDQSSLKKQWSKDDYTDPGVSVRISEKKSSKTKKSSAKTEKMKSNQAAENHLSQNSKESQLFGSEMNVRSGNQQQESISSIGGSSFGFISSTSPEESSSSSSAFSFISQADSSTNINTGNFSDAGKSNSSANPTLGFLSAIKNPSSGANTKLNTHQAPSVPRNDILDSLSAITINAPIKSSSQQPVSFDELLNQKSMLDDSNDESVLVSSISQPDTVEEDSEFEVITTLKGEKKVKKKNVVKDARPEIKVDADPWNNGLVNLNALNAKPKIEKETGKIKKAIDPLDPFSGL
jgi:hypothetical protein